MSNEEALKEIYESIVWFEATRKDIENDMQAVVVYGLALGRIELVLETVGFDVEGLKL